MLKSKINIAAVSVAIFFLGTGQTYVIAKFIQPEVASIFFYIQSFMIFAATIGNSTIMIKNFSKIDDDRRTFNPFFLAFQASITLLISIASVFFLYHSSELSIYACMVLLLSATLNANTSITSFLRLFDGPFIMTQWMRVALLSFKLSLLLWLPYEEISLLQLLLIILTADILNWLGLAIIMSRLKSQFILKLSAANTEKLALFWGSVNASMRNVPRLLVFYFTERYFDAQTLVNLRLLLIPRENLASMMGVVNLIFYKEIFKNNKHIVFWSIFSLCTVFQLTLVFALNIAQLEIHLTTEAVIFYLSASTVYSIVQQHWAIVKSNLEHIQTKITAVALLTTIVFISIDRHGLLGWNVLSYLTIFNVVWSVLIIRSSTK